MNFDEDEVEITTIPKSQAVIDKEDLEAFLTCTKHVFPTKAKFMSFVRSGVRQGIWNKHPLKMELLKSRRRRIKNPRPNPRKGAETVWGFECNICKGEFTQANCEVDHIKGEASLRDIDDIVKFFKDIILVTPSDLQIVCKHCHGIKTYAERYNVSMERSEAIKMAIATLKTDDWKKELKRLGVTKMPTKTAARGILENLYEQEITEVKSAKRK